MTAFTPDHLSAADREEWEVLEEARSNRDAAFYAASGDAENERAVLAWADAIRALQAFEAAHPVPEPKRWWVLQYRDGAVKIEPDLPTNPDYRGGWTAIASVIEGQFAGEADAKMARGEVG